jgi:tetratricopeptide (TPR) repeat protein
MAGDISTLIQKGDALDRQWDTNQALQIYLQAAQTSSKDGEILYRIAREYGLSMDDVAAAAAKRERGEKALDYAKQAVAADPKNANAQLALAISYGRLAPFLDNKTKMSYGGLVKTHADLALSLNPNDDLTYHVLGAWNYEFSNLNPILRAIASALYGSLPNASNEEAVQDFQKALALNPNRISSHVELGRTYIALGQNAKARVELEKALSLPEVEKDDRPEKKIAEKALGSL